MDAGAGGEQEEVRDRGGRQVMRGVVMAGEEVVGEEEAHEEVAGVDVPLMGKED